MGNKRTLNILLVDDHADTRKMLGMFLALLGHGFESAGDVAVALGKAGRGPFDVLLTDVHMPGASGWDLVRELSARGHLPSLVISMSAGVVEAEAVQSKAAGCHAHLRKPFPVGELEAALALGHV